MQDPPWSKMQNFFLSDEEMGKKDDDHKHSQKKSRTAWNPARPPTRRSLKRLGLVAFLVAVAYVFFKNIPDDLGIRDHRRPVYIYPGDQPESPKSPPPKSSPPPKAVKDEQKGVEPVVDDQARQTKSDRSYNGPMRFLNLASSLHGISGTRGGLQVNKNVLFAAASLKSAATLLPVACQMGSELRSYVHFALMSRSEIDIDELRELNGIDDSCEIIFHDARPEFSEISTVARLRLGVARALYHINMYMHPQAIIVDDSSLEEAFFSEAVGQQTRAINIPLIGIPHNGAQKLAWMTKLDSASLSAWKKLNVDILIHASPGASGSLIRLLKSLSAADFTSSPVPHLTIELPQDIPASTKQFIEDFQWPPAHVPNPTNVRQLSLRHRIPLHGVSEDENSVRFLESFWPTHPDHSHVLVLSPQAELSPNFLHYLKYTILQYRYSNAAIMQEWDKRLFGISLDLPSMHLDSTRFSPPPSAGGTDDTRSDTASFLWQAPNSNAVLFLGERWVELHGFVSQLLKAQQNHHHPPQLLAEKLVSKRYPSWLEQALRLCQARGYLTLYPSQSTSGALAVVHSELYTPPEEYGDDLPAFKADEGAEVELTSTSFLETLPNRGSLLPFQELPLLAWDGKTISLQDFNAAAIEYSTEFKRQVAGCDPEGLEQVIQDASAKDLFCKNSRVQLR